MTNIYFKILNSAENQVSYKRSDLSHRCTLRTLSLKLHILSKKVENYSAPSPFMWCGEVLGALRHSSIAQYESTVSLV